MVENASKCLLRRNATHRMNSIPHNRNYQVFYNFCGHYSFQLCLTRTHTHRKAELFKRTRKEANNSCSRAKLGMSQELWLIRGKLYGFESPQLGFLHGAAQLCRKDLAVRLHCKNVSCLLTYRHTAVNFRHFLAL